MWLCLVVFGCFFVCLIIAGTVVGGFVGCVYFDCVGLVCIGIDFVVFCLLILIVCCVVVVLIVDYDGCVYILFNSVGLILVL